MRAWPLIPVFLTPAVLVLAGCGYVHIGRLPSAPAATAMAPVGADERLIQENAGLRLEKTMLQQELAITRAQGEALRMALENRAADGGTSRQLIARLNETTRELATLRASYAELQRQGGQGTPGTGAPGPLQAQLVDTEEKLAASLRSYTDLQAEINRLRSELVRTRVENAGLSARVKAVTAENEQAQAALAQLNTELLAQKDARLQAEQDAETFRTELKMVAPSSTVLAQHRSGAAGEVRSLAAEHAAETAALKRQLKALRNQVEALQPSKGGDASVAAAAPPHREPAPAAAAPVANAPVVVEAEHSTGGPVIIVEAARIDLGTASTPPPGSNGSSAGASKGGTSSVQATLVTRGGSRGGANGRSETSEPRTHVVASGDTLAKISTQYYGTAARWGDILAANRDVLGDENKLVVGRTLRIP